MSSTIVAVIALSLYVILTAYLYSQGDGRRATMIAILGGTMFVPVFDEAMRIPVLTTKSTFVPAVALGASLLLDGPRWRRLRLSAFDLPMALFCVLPFCSSISNGLGAYDGFVSLVQRSSAWGGPYLLGRVYMGTPRDARPLAAGVIAAGLLYTPFCLYEIRMSPLLHYKVYGFGPSHSFADTARGGMFRPSVFMDHGLMVGMFLASATLVAFWMWRTRSLSAVWNVPIGWCVVVLGGTTVLAKSYGAIALLVAGIGVLESTRRWRRGILAVVLALGPTAYSVARTSGWNAQSLVSAATSVTNAERSASLAFRLENEDLLVARAFRRPWLGWAGWGRNLADAPAFGLPVTDGLWVIILGINGLLGLGAMWLVLGVPALGLLRRMSARFWVHPLVAPTAAMAVCTLLWAVDDILNAMHNPMFPLFCGAVTSFALQPRTGRQRPRPQRQPAAAQPAPPPRSAAPTASPAAR